jgi:hypothetical protein
MPGQTDERDRELAERYLRLAENDGGVDLEVGIVEWNGAHTPYVEWKAVEHFAAMPSAEEFEKAKRRVLRNRRYFRTCKFCKQRCNAGHMNSNVCHSCAEKHLGVIH